MGCQTTVMSGESDHGQDAEAVVKPDDGEIRDADIHRVLVDYATDVLWLLHPDYTVRYVSRAVDSLLGWSSEELVGGHPMQLAHPADVSLVEEVILRARAGEPGPFTFTVRVRRKDGTYVWVECRSLRIRDPGSETFRQGVVVTMRDITVRKKLETELAALATTDPLTQLANRRAFDEALANCWQDTLSEDGEMSLVIGDIDFFKNFNDSFGHQAGDDCLRTVASVFREIARDVPGALATRYGGEEMAVVLPAVGLEQACAIGEGLRARVEALRLPHGRNRGGFPFVTVSIGVATATARAEHTVPIPQSLVFAADVALYKAKRAGRNRVSATYPETADRAARERVGLPPAVQ